MGAFDDHDPRDERIAQLEASLRRMVRWFAPSPSVPAGIWLEQYNAHEEACTILAGKVAE